LSLASFETHDLLDELYRFVEIYVYIQYVHFENSFMFWKNNFAQNI